MSRRRSGSSDTAPAAATVMTELRRHMTPAQRGAKMVSLNRTCRSMAIAGIRQRHPEASDHEVSLRWAALRLDRSTMIAAYGWDPEVEGY